MSDEVAVGSHLYWSELACHDGLHPYPLDKRDSVLLPRLLPAWITLRHRNGDTPIIVISAYRTPEWNRKEGGEPGSYHVTAEAVDVSAGRYRPCLEFGKLAVLEARAGGLIRGVGFYPDFGTVHIDVHPGPLRLWRCIVSGDGHTKKIKRTYLPWSGEAYE